MLEKLRNSFFKTQNVRKYKNRATDTYVKLSEESVRTINGRKTSFEVYVSASKRKYCPVFLVTRNFALIVWNRFGKVDSIPERVLYFEEPEIDRWLCYL